MSALEVIARAIEPDAFDQPPEFEPWAAQRRVSAYAKARKYLAALDAAGLAVAPKEPTREMQRALVGWTLGPLPGSLSATAISRHRAMLAAAVEGAANEAGP